jgi:beta-lactam-binding protein with PASTA domain
MRQFFNILLGALAMLAVALLSAFLAMRLAIHGREVEVPNVTGLTVAEASQTAARLGLNLNLENHFYSTVVPPGSVLSQAPAPGTKVRREWVLRVTESIGPQRVSVPNVVGQTEREATVTIRRLALELGTVAYIPAAGTAGIVLAQTPTAAAEGVDGPRISLLVSEPVPSARPRITASAGTDTVSDGPVEAQFGPPPAAVPATETPGQAGTPSPEPLAGAPAQTQAQTPADIPQPEAFVMPNLVGVSIRVAQARVAAVGLTIATIQTMTEGVRPIAPIGTHGGLGSGPIAPVAPIVMPNTVLSQSPAAGRKVTKKDAIRVVVSR